MILENPGWYTPVHALSIGDRARPSRSAAHVPDHGDGPDGDGSGQRVAARRGDGRGGSDGHAAARAQAGRGGCGAGAAGCRHVLPADDCGGPGARRAAGCHGAGRADRRLQLRARRLRRDRAVARYAWGPDRSGAGHRAGARGRRRRGGRGRPAVAGAGEASRRAGRRHRLRQFPALWRAAGLRRAARRLLRHPPGVRAPDAGAADRCVGGLARPSGVPHGALHPRTAHPAREGHVEHLHRAGAPGVDGGDVRRVSRARGLARDRRQRARARARARTAAVGGRATANATPPTSTR